MRKRDERLDVIFQTFVDHALIKREPQLVGLGFESRWINTRPVHREAECLKSHLGKKRDVFPVMMVEINAVMRGIQMLRIKFHVDNARMVMVAVGAVVYGAGALTVNVPCSPQNWLAAVAPPHKNPFGKTAIWDLLSLSSSPSAHRPKATIQTNTTRGARMRANTPRSLTCFRGVSNWLGHERRDFSSSA